MLEALASGCITLSYPTGFALDAINNDFGTYVLPFDSDTQRWYNRIVELICTAADINYDWNMHERATYLKSAKFSTLCGRLEKVFSSS